MEEKRLGSAFVKESGSCPLWEKSELPAVVVLRECWFCKWSDFRRDFNEHKSVGYCYNPEKK